MTCSGLKGAMGTKGLTNQSLSTQSGIPIARIDEILNEGKEATATELETLCTHLGVTVPKDHVK